MPIVMINCLIFLSGHRIVCGRARDHVIPGSSHPQTPLLRSNPNPVCLGSANSLQFYILWGGKKNLVTPFSKYYATIANLEND